MAVRVTTADFVKNFGLLSDHALIEPVTITKHGRDRLVVVSATEYERLKRRDRQVLLSAELPDRILQRIAEAEVPPGHSDLDAELPANWKP